MLIEVPAANPAPAAPAPASTSGSPAGTGSSPDEVKALKETLEEVKQRLQDQSKIIANLQKQPAKVEPTAADPLSDRVKTLEERDAKAAAREKTQKDRETLTQVKAALINNGVPADKAERSAKVLIAEHGAKVNVDDEFNVVVKDGDKPVDVNTWIGAYMQTNEGKFFLPPVLNPSSAGLAASGVVAPSGKTPITRAQLQDGKFDLAAMKAGKYEIID